MRIPRPSPALVVASLALLLAAGGGAFAAVRSTGSATNIVDATDPARIAHVNAAGAVMVKVAGSVTIQATPSSFLRGKVNPVSSACTPLISPPAQKAMVLTQVTLNVWSVDQGFEVNIYAGSNCTQAELIGYFNPTTTGTTVMPFNPGIGIPAGSVVSVLTGGSPGAGAFALGYSVPASLVPAAPGVAEPQG
jgi:hypothetical protein